MFDDRKIMILYSIINTYITDGEPVGSKSLAKEYNLDISPATIRNEMSSLEKMGFLQKAHTSSGRLPSDRGYRIYVDNILSEQVENNYDHTKNNIAKLLDKNTFSPENIMENATKILSDITNCTAISLTISSNIKKLISVELIPITQKKLVLICVYDNGMVLDERIILENLIDVSKIEYLNNCLKDIIKEDDYKKTLEKLKDVYLKDLENYKELVSKIIDILDNEENLETKSEVMIEGLGNIFNFKEFSDLKKAKELIKFFDAKERIKDLLDGINKPLEIKIGNENYPKELKNTTLITSHFNYDKNTFGQIGVIGPTRIRYKKIIDDIQLISYLLNH
ncbi:MAG: heat-inducible transcriptional repressor HrcA [Tissierellia bacterium]|nr:heat-inducible transcriptional repressor HrcA [Tissierellia bacterium]